MIICNGLVFTVENGNTLVVYHQEDSQHTIVYSKKLGKCPASKQETDTATIEGNTYVVTLSCNGQWKVDKVDQVDKN
ncbi:MAG: hypothetical protein JXR48_14870 [Candidatus Delongbacteria bacterium]|nr:hypothetical protein [Candidatus Delongbacteria bacterium]MBN2836239.1 hypothetical protein [Candidatus Delongbacteria bacterium]